jgi:transcriptional regulator with XRE-family HTH domain
MSDSGTTRRSSPYDAPHAAPAASSIERDPAYPDEVATAIGVRRRELGWSFAKLAKLSGLQSSAYVFHIENGHKLPSEPVARRIAAALGLDAELLAAWSRARGRADLPNALEAARTLSRLLGRQAPAAPQGHAIHTEAASRGPAATPPRAPIETADLLAVPLLPEGFDPAALADERLPALDTLRLDRRLFPPLAAVVRPIAYRLSAHGARGIPDVLAPGDCVVVSRDGETPALESPVALRRGGRVEIARWRGDLPVAATAPDSDRPVEPAASASDVIGRVVVAFRRWL